MKLFRPLVAVLCIGLFGFTANLTAQCNNPISLAAFGIQLTSENPLTVDERLAYCVNNDIFTGTVTLSFASNQPPLTVRITPANQSAVVLNGNGESFAFSPGNYRIVIRGRRVGAATLTFSGTIRIFFNTPFGPIAFNLPFTQSLVVTVEPNLPVTWMDPLEATPQGKLTQFTWSVADQVDVAGYELERNAGEGFEMVKWVDMIENGDGEVKYAATDFTPQTSTYYRIRQLDHDGQFSYSNIILVGGEADDSPTLFPNPASGSVMFTAAPTQGNIALLSAAGQLLREIPATQNGSLNLEGLSAGMYIVRFSDEAGNVQQRKLVVR